MQNQDGQDEHINLYEECIINDNILLDNDKSMEKSSDEITNIQVNTHTSSIYVNAIYLHNVKALFYLLKRD